MCELMGFDIDERYHGSGNYDWIAERGMLKIHSLDGKVTVLLRTGGSQTVLYHIQYTEQLRWLYYYLHNEKI